MTRDPRGVRYASIYDKPPPAYTGPHWIGKAIKAPPIEAGPGWIGKRIPFRKTAPALKSITGQPEIKDAPRR